MNIFIHKSAGLALVSALVLAPTLSFAQIELEVSATGSIDGTIDSATDVNATLSDSVIEMNVGTDTSDISEPEDQASDTEALAQSPSGAVVSSAAQVQTDADLESFRQNLAVNHEAVEAVRIDTDEEGTTEVEVNYRHSGKLIGLIPVTVRSATVVKIEADGTIDVDSNVPWWSLMVTRIDHAEREIEARVKDNPTVMTNVELGLSARGKAEIAEAIIAELQAHASLQAALLR